MKNFFDQPYYRLNKLFMTHLGIWPEQSLLERCLIPCLYIITLVGSMIPELVRMSDVWGDVSHVVECLPPILTMNIVIIKLLNGSFHIITLRTMLSRMKNHWECMGNSPNIEILHKHGRRGRLITVAYIIYWFSSMSLYLGVNMQPLILDVLFPLNGSRPMQLPYEVNYGVNEEDYFTAILLHSYFATCLVMVMLISVDTMFFTFVEHACGLFEMVGANMKLINESVHRSTEDDHKKICYCVKLHKEALTFADLIESNYSTSITLVVGLCLLVTSISGVLVLLKKDNFDELVRFGTFVVGQVLHIFFNSIPGQQIIDYSLRVHDTVYDSQWTDFDKKNQKLVLLILMRSQKPCILTASGIFIVSMASFASMMQTTMSYFTVLSSML